MGERVWAQVCVQVSVYVQLSAGDQVVEHACGRAWLSVCASEHSVG